MLQKIDHKHPNLTNHGRKTWSYGQELKSDRLNKMRLVLDALEENGSPMRLKDIKDKVSKTRSLGLLQPYTSKANPDLIQLGDGMWGLRWRDVELTELEESLIYKNILSEFKRGKKNLNEKDIQGILDMLGINTINSWLASRILLRHTATNTDRSGEHFKISFDVKSESFLISDITA